MTNTAFPLQNNTQFGRYYINSLLAKGGMAEVWHATAFETDKTQKDVVLKTMLPEISASAEFVEMFLNEASLSAKLKHLNIVQVFDFGELDKRYFIAMEYVPGKSLRQINEKLFRLGLCPPVWFAIWNIIEICTGLQYAHELKDSQGNPLGLVHLDVSPDNVMLSFDGTPKLLDFGLALPMAKVELKGIQRSLGRTYYIKKVLGKTHYIAPERIRGLLGDHRSDIYSLGAILYEMITQKKPFQGKNDTEILTKIVNGDFPPPSALVPDFPKSLNQTILRAMANKPENRFQSMKELRLTLLEYFCAHYHNIDDDLSSYIRFIFSKMSESEPKMQFSKSRANHLSVSQAALSALTKPLTEETLFEELTQFEEREALNPGGKIVDKVATETMSFSEENKKP